MMTDEQLLALIGAVEADRLECKSARTGYQFDELAQYATALANEGGGHILLGVTDARPREIVGTAAFAEPGRTAAGLYERIDIRVQVSEHHIDGSRVLVFVVPSHRPGLPVSCEGAYWMRAGDALVRMSPERLQEIFRETEPDFSAEACPGLELSDLSLVSIEEFRRRWIARSGNARLAALDHDALLRDADLLDHQGHITYAALILLGLPASVNRFLPAAEVVHEYRSTEAAGPAQDRAEFREGFLLTSDVLWERMNARNDRQSIQEGFFRRDIPTFDEGTVREAVLNAVAHRDYRSPRSVFVVQYPRRLEVVSPGGLPDGVTAENILSQQHPRNRRLAEGMNRIGLVERAGQGVNLMFERSLQQGKQLPSYTGSNAHEVRLVLDGLVTNAALLAVVEQISAETLRGFVMEDFLVLDHLQRGQDVPRPLRSRLPALHELGLVEQIGRGRSVRYLISRRVASAMGQAGTYTRRRGLDHETNKALLLQHLKTAGVLGSNLSELHQVLHTLSRGQVQDLLQGLRKAGLVRLVGARRWARWFHSEAAL